MPTGRRGFFKQLGGVLAGLTVAGRLKLEQERKVAPPYVRKYMQNAIPVNPSLPSYGCSGVWACSGYYIPTICSGIFLHAVSGSFANDNPPIRPPKLIDELF